MKSPFLLKRSEERRGETFYTDDHNKTAAFDDAGRTGARATLKSSTSLATQTRNTARGMEEAAYLCLSWGTKRENFVDALYLGSTLRKQSNGRCRAMIKEDTAHDAKNTGNDAS